MARVVHLLFFCRISLVVEHRTCNAEVVSSILTFGSFFLELCLVTFILIRFQAVLSIYVTNMLIMPFQCKHTATTMSQLNDIYRQRYVPTPKTKREALDAISAVIQQHEEAMAYKFNIPTPGRWTLVDYVDHWKRILAGTHVHWDDHRQNPKNQSREDFLQESIQNQLRVNRYPPIESGLVPSAAALLEYRTNPKEIPMTVGLLRALRDALA